MERTYSGHQDDKNNEDISLHEISCRKVEELIQSSGLSFTPSDDNTIMKDCYQYTLSNGVALQVISANIERTPSSQKAITIEHRGPFIKGKMTGGFFSKGRIRGSKADVIAFVIHENNKFISTIFVEPNKLVEYLDSFYNILNKAGIKTLANCSNPKKQAIQEWNMAYKIDSHSKKRIIAPILIEELENMQTNLSSIIPKPQKESKTERKPARKSKTLTSKVISKTQTNPFSFEVSIKGQNMNLQMSVDSQDTIKSILKVLMPI